MVRSTRGEKLLERARRRRGTSWARLAPEPQALDAKAADAVPRPGETPADSDPRAGSATPAGGPSCVEADPSLDVAVYSCSCGLVFEAPVSTSVGCPHCGVQLAW